MPNSSESYIKAIVHRGYFLGTGLMVFALAFATPPGAPLTFGMIPELVYGALGVLFLIAGAIEVPLKLHRFLSVLLPLVLIVRGVGWGLSGGSEGPAFMVLFFFSAFVAGWFAPIVMWRHTVGLDDYVRLRHRILDLTREVNDLEEEAHEQESRDA